MSNNCIENNGVAFFIKNGVTHIWDFRGKKILVSRDLKMERFTFKKVTESDYVGVPKVTFCPEVTDGVCNFATELG